MAIALEKAVRKAMKSPSPTGSTGSVATLLKNFFQSSLWKRYCSTFDV